MASKTSSSLPVSATFASRGVATVIALMFAGSIALAGSAGAQVIGDTTSIGADSGVNNHGAISVNQVSGVGNQQANTALITDQPGQLSLDQESVGEITSVADSGKTIIGNDAFTNSSGLIQVSQTSGAGNVGANAAFVGVSATGSAVDAISLSQTRAGFSLPDPNSPQFNAQYSMASTAFAGSSGLVQVQQTAGNNNVAANSVAVNFAH